VTRDNRNRDSSFSRDLTPQFIEFCPSFLQRRLVSSLFSINIPYYGICCARKQQQPLHYNIIIWGKVIIMTISKFLERSAPSLPNILIIITDQERALQHWPEESFPKQQYLPSMERLKKHGLDCQQHYTNSCMCSPSRATLLTSQFPAVTGVTR
jgi:hypothetical protein